MIKKSKKESNFFLRYDSDEYQRLLVGFKIFTCFLSRKSFVNRILFASVSTVLIFTIITIYAIFINNSEVNIFLIFPFIMIYIAMFIFIIVANISEKYKFSLRKGFKILFRERSSTIGFIVLLGLGTSILIIDGLNDFSIRYFLYFLGIAFFIKILSLSLNLIFKFDLHFYLKYINEIVQRLSDNEEENLNKYEFIYYAIKCYSRRLIKIISDIYGNDVVKLLKMENLALLSSQVIYKERLHRMELLKILKDLMEIKVITKSGEFIKLMNKIEKFVGSYFGKDFVKYVKEDFFRRMGFFEYLKNVVVPVIPIIYIVIYIFNL